MFKKLLNVGKGHSSERAHHHHHHASHNQHNQHQQKNLFELNEIRSYGFSHLCCIGYSSTLSLLAVGSKSGVLRILGNPPVEFSYKFDIGHAIKLVEFIDCRTENISNKHQDKKQPSSEVQAEDGQAAAKLVVLTDNGQLHLFELKTVKQMNLADNTTQTENEHSVHASNLLGGPDEKLQQFNVPEYTKLAYVGVLDYFVHKVNDEDRSKRVTTLEILSTGQSILIGTEGGNLYQVTLNKFEPIKNVQQNQNNELKSEVQPQTGIRPILDDIKEDTTEDPNIRQVHGDEFETVVNLNDEPHIDQNVVEPFEVIKFEEDITNQIGEDIKPKKQGAIESIKKHPTSTDKILVSYHRGLSIIINLKTKQVDKYFFHNQILESSCFASQQSGDYFYTSHNDGSYIKWDTRNGNQTKANDDSLGQLYGPYPCKPIPKIQACGGLFNDQVEDLIIFSGGMPRATYDDKNPVTIVRAESNGKDVIKTVLDFTSKVVDFVVITRPRGNLGVGAKSTGGGKKGKNKQQQQQQRNQHIAIALAILAEEEFVVIDLLNSESYLEFPLPYLNCVQPSAITCNQHYSNISDELYEQLLRFNKQQLKGKFSQNEWPITGGKVTEAPELKSHDMLLTGHEDGSVNIWDVSDLSMRHLFSVQTAKLFSTGEDDSFVDDDQKSCNADDSGNNNESTKDDSWPPLKRVGRYDPYSDDTRLAIRKLSLCPQSGTLLVAGTGGKYTSGRVFACN